MDWDPDSFVAACLAAELDVVAITDHDNAGRAGDVIRAAQGTKLQVIPGIELSTDRGHVLVLSPGQVDTTIIREFIERVGAVDGGQVELMKVLDAATERRMNGEPFSEVLVLIGAHVDVSGSLLASSNSMNVETQIKVARRLHALEVVDQEKLSEWKAGGVKQSDYHFTLVRGSDNHDPEGHRDVTSWIYLPRITCADFRHAFAVPEASVLLQAEQPSDPEYVIESMTIEGGLHDKKVFSFSERTNAIIGPPSVGKSLVVDALKFAFGIESDIPEIEDVTRARMEAQLPTGSVVRTVVRTGAGRFTLTRTVGGSATSSPPFVPIVFSQTELTRRGIANRPAIQLLDLHCQEIGDSTEAIRSAAASVYKIFTKAIELAGSAHELSLEVLNPEDGLTASESALAELAGSEVTANLASDAEKVSEWRREMLGAIDDWETDHDIGMPDWPRKPDISSKDQNLKESIRTKHLKKVTTASMVSLQQGVAGAAEAMRLSLGDKDQMFAETEDAIEKELESAGFETGSELAQELEVLKTRVATLSKLQKRLLRLEKKINSKVADLREAVGEVQLERQLLSQHRKTTCTLVNSSMHSFFALVDPDGETSMLDALFEDLKTGTNLHSKTQRTVLLNLDRFRLLETAVRLVQGQSPEEDPAYAHQDKVVSAALDRDKRDGLSELACLWPGDRLDLHWKHTSPPTAFGGLTEGLRALAIKELSFAASGLPVITDQPEDAVPTRAVFDVLVPTLREQRIRRQFIVVSHDANIVVTSDVEVVIALGAGENGSTHVGNLFDQPIRDAALVHLEGGRSAFDLRAERYAQPRMR